MLKIDRVIIVEGKYDKIKLSSFIESTIITTNGFRLFKDKSKLNLIREMAKKKGILIITDSDSAGFMIRNYLKSAISEDKITNVYIPDVFGKEKRKSLPSKEGKLGVEGLSEEIILKAIKNSGIDIENINDTNSDSKKTQKITMSDFYSDGLTGSKGSKKLRSELLRYLNLPEYISAKTLLDILNYKMNIDEYKKLIEKVKSINWK